MPQRAVRAPATRGSTIILRIMPYSPLPVDTAQHLASHFVLNLARALHAHGYPAHRLEEVLGEVAGRLGIEAQFFTTPTSIFASFGTPDMQRTHLLRVQPGQPNLGHLSRLDVIMGDVLDGAISASEGSARIVALVNEPPRWSRWPVLGAFLLSSGSVACFFRVSVFEALVAALLGLVTGVLALLATRRPALGPVLEPLTAGAVATLAFLIAGLTSSGNAYQTSLAGLIVLLPGLSFTLGLTELSTQHLASGTARLAGSLVTFLGLGFGLVLGAQLGGGAATLLRGGNAVWLLFSPQVAPWTEPIAAIVAPICFAVLLRADRKDTGWIVLAGATAYGTSRLAGRAFGDELAAFIAAFVVSAGSNLLARWRRSTAMVTLVPGLLILVPGSAGFRSVSSLLGNETIAGVEAAFRVALVGISLAAGILAGNLVLGYARTPRYPQVP